MTFERINSILLERLPELENAIKEEVDYWKGEDVPCHVLYENALNQSGFMYNLLTQESDIDLIKKVFDFFEEMALSDDSKVVQCATTEMLIL